MAKLQYFAAIPDNSNWSTPFVKSFKMDIHSGNFAEFVPAVAGDNVTVTFEGTGFVYNAAGVPIAAGVLYPFLGLLLSPIIAAAAMSFSSVSVITNALRLKKIAL